MKDFESKELEKNIDLKKIFFRSLNYWYIFVICIVLVSTYAVYSHLTTTPMYRIGTKLLIGRDNSLGEGVGAAGAASLPTVMVNQSIYENQYIILTSRKQIEKTLRQLDFEISYYLEDRYREIEIYKDSPFKVIIDSSEVRVSDLNFDVQFLTKDEFQLTLNSGGTKYSQQVKFFEKVNHPRFSFTIVPVEEKIAISNYEGRLYRFSINTMDRLIGQYQGNVDISLVTGGSSIMEISILESNTQKGIDFLNKFALASVGYSLDKKNQISTNTITFIDKQLAGVTDSLSAVENDLEVFRSRQGGDLSLQGSMIMTQSRELQTQIEVLKSHMDYYNYLQDYLENSRDIQDLLAPSSSGVNDPTIASYIGQLFTLNSQRAQYLFNSSTENPNVVRINSSIETLKNSIIQAVLSVKATTQMSIDNLESRMLGFSNDMRRLPRAEQALVGIQRSVSLNSDMYNFLMQKRSEAQLAKAANLSDNEIVEEALIKAQVAPDVKKNIMLVLIGGLLVPVIIVFLTIFLNDKVLDIADIKEITSASIIGQIPLEKIVGKKKTALSSDQPNTVLAESFRNIRVSLGFYASNKGNKTILFTSTLPGEGKSFCALNLAHSFAQLGKKTILVEYDMRRPSVARQSGIKPGNMGLSNYYTGERNLENIIIKETKVPNFHIIFSGQIPPNPAELIASDETSELVESLQKQYEIVIIDTPPLGLVSDAHLLTRFSDVNLLVIRHNSTPKPVLKMNLRDEKTQNIQNLAIILNGIPFQRREYNYQYGYDVRSKYITRKG